MDNPFVVLDQRLDQIEKSLQLILESRLTSAQVPTQSEPRSEETFNIQQLSEYLGRDKSTIHRYKNNRVFPFYQAGRTVFFKKSEVDAAMASVQPKSKKGGPQ
jgi:excisionase family DNA binding protein